jgi:hypothetical protein
LSQEQEIDQKKDPPDRVTVKNLSWSHVTDKNTKKRGNLNAQDKSDVPQRKRQRLTCDALIESFHNSIECGPEYICTCCDQL